MRELGSEVFGPYCRRHLFANFSTDFEMSPRRLSADTGVGWSGVYVLKYIDLINENKIM
jgi:hypothetical protein